MERGRAAPLGPPLAPPASERRPTLDLVFLIFSLLLALIVAVGLGWFFGRQIMAEEWDILVPAVGLATYIIIALIDARHALLIWVVTAPFSRFVGLDLDFGRGIPNITLNRVMTGVLLVLLLAQLAIRSRQMARLRAADVFAVAFGGAMVLTAPNSTMGFTSAIQAVFDLVITPVGLYLLARNLIATRRDLRAMMVALTIIGTYLGLLATREQLTGDVWFYPEARSVYYTATIRRVVGLLGNPAFIAACIGVAVPWTLYLLLTARRHRLLYLFASLSMVSGIFFCMNRSGWVGLVISLVVMALFVRRFRPVFLMMLLVGAIVAGLYWAVIISSPTVRERLTAEGPIEYRREAWRVAWEMIQDYPVFGVGWENYRSLYRSYSLWSVYLRAEPSPHNTYIWVQITGGVVALAPFLAFLAAATLPALGIYVRARREGSPDADLAGVYLASVSAMLAPAVVMDIFAGYYNGMLLFLIMGAFYGAMGDQAGRSQEEEMLAAALLGQAP